MKTTENLQEGLRNELLELQRWRDELRVQMHLGKAEARAALERLEQKWPDVERGLSALEQDTEHAIDQLRANVRTLIDEIRSSYQALKPPPRAPAP